MVNTTGVTKGGEKSDTHTRSHRILLIATTYIDIRSYKNRY